MKEHAVNLLAAEGYGHLLDDSKPFYKHMQDVRALPENILSYEVDPKLTGRYRQCWYVGLSFVFEDYLGHI